MYDFCLDVLAGAIVIGVIFLILWLIAFIMGWPLFYTMVFFILIIAPCAILGSFLRS